jgi:hypothetical protein
VQGHRRREGRGGGQPAGGSSGGGSDWAAHGDADAIGVPCALAPASAAACVRRAAPSVPAAERVSQSYDRRDDPALRRCAGRARSAVAAAEQVSLTCDTVDRARPHRGVLRVA